MFRLLLREIEIKMISVSLIGLVGVDTPLAAQAAEAITRTHDVMCRLVKVERAETDNNNVKVNYSHDQADNRTDLKIIGPPTSAPPP